MTWYRVPRQEDHNGQLTTSRRGSFRQGLRSIFTLRSAEAWPGGYPGDDGPGIYDSHPNQFARPSTSPTDWNADMLNELLWAASPFGNPSASWEPSKAFRLRFGSSCPLILLLGASEIMSWRDVAMQMRQQGLTCTSEKV